MKRIPVLLLAAALCLWLAACSKKPEPEPISPDIHTEATDTEGSEEIRQQNGSSAHSGNPEEKSEEPIQQNIELAGP